MTGEEELIKIWQSSPNQERLKFEKSRLLLDVQSGLDRLQRDVRGRDRRELAGVLIGAPVMAYYIYIVPSMVSKIAAALAILWGIYVVLRLRKANALRPVSSAGPYLEYLRQSRTYLLGQVELLDTILYWYILPGWLTVSLFIGGMISAPGKLLWVVLAEIGNVIFAVVIYVMNKSALKTHLQPRLHKVDDLIRSLEQA